MTVTNASKKKSNRKRNVIVTSIVALGVAAGLTFLSGILKTDLSPAQKLVEEIVNKGIDAAVDAAAPKK